VLLSRLVDAAETPGEHGRQLHCEQQTVCVLVGHCEHTSKTQMKADLRFTGPVGEFFGTAVARIAS
jgi:hypothetical protein